MDRSPTVSSIGYNDFQAIQEVLKTTEDEGLKKYRDCVSTLFNTKYPLTEKQIEAFHTEIKELIIKAFEETYHPMKTNPENTGIIEDARATLTKKIATELATTLKRHEVSMDKITSWLRGCTLKAENHYDDLMMDFVPSESTRENSVNRHKVARDAAINKFITAISQPEGMEAEESWKVDLESVLERKLEDMLQECILAAESSTLSVNQVNQGERILADGAAGQYATAAMPPEGTGITSSVANKIQRPLDIGIYFGKTSLMVGRIRKGTADLEVIMTMPPEIAFLEDAVVIGEDAARFQNQRNHVHLSDAMSNPFVTLSINSWQFRLSGENVLKVFFIQLGKHVLALTSSTSICNAVLTISYATTSNDRTLLKTAALTAFKNVRILSSLLTTTLAYAAHSQFYLQEEKDQNSRFVLAAQSLSEGFSIAVLEIGRGEIATRNVITSRNIPECATDAFLRSQSKIFLDGRLEAHQQHHLLSLYRDAGEKLLRSIPQGRECEQVLEIKSSRGFTDIFRSIFKDHAALSVCCVEEGPLLGACILAGRDNPVEFHLPAQILVCDKSPNTFSVGFGENLSSQNLTSIPGSNGQELKELNDSSFYPEEYFFQPFSLRTGQFSSVVLQESYVHNKVCNVIDKRYFIEDAQSQERYVSMRVKCDEDGVLSLISEQVSID